MAPIVPVNPFEPPPPPPHFKDLPKPVWTIIYWAGKVGAAIEAAIEKCKKMIWGDADLLRTKNDEWNSISGSIAAARSSLDAPVNEMSSQWQGKAEDAFLGYKTVLQERLGKLADACKNVAAALSKAATEVSNLRTAVITACVSTAVAIGVAVGAAFFTAGLSLSLVLEILGVWAIAMIAIWGAWQSFFNNMASAFDDGESLLNEIRDLHRSPQGFVPKLPGTVGEPGGWDVTLDD